MSGKLRYGKQLIRFILKTDVGQASLWKTIDSLYPSDMAFGFQPGDLRGIWHVTFIKK